MIYKRQIISINGISNYIFLEVHSIGYCNQKCAYCCYKYLNNNIALNLDQLYDFILYLKKISTKDIYVSLLGGEPTLHPQLIEFVKKISNSEFNQHIQVVVMSNFSADISLYNWLLNNNVKLLLTWHSLPDDPFNTSFIEKTMQLDKSHQNFLIHIMYENDIAFKVFQQINEIYPYNSELTILSYNRNTSQINFVDFKWQYTTDQLLLYQKIKEQEKHNITPAAHAKYEVIFDDNTSIILSDLKDGKKSENYEYLKQLFYLECGIRNFKHWYCYAGKNYFWIDVNGFVYPCYKFFLDKKVKRHITNIDNMRLRGQICPYDKCDQIFEVGKIRLDKIKLKHL